MDSWWFFHHHFYFSNMRCSYIFSLFFWNRVYLGSTVVGYPLHAGHSLGICTVGSSPVRYGYRDEKHRRQACLKNLFC